MEELGKKIKELAKKYRDLTAQNLSEQIKVKGLSQEEEGICKVIKKQLEDAGCDSVKIDGFGNVVGRIGSGKTILAFDGHVDTVDVGLMKNWTECKPFSGDIRDGKVWGRGTADQRGGIAAFITTAKILKELKFDKDLTVYFVGSCMEEDCDGLCWKYIIEKEKLKPDFCVSTESTQCTVYRGHRGRMEIQVAFRGVSCHGSAPHRGRNAIYMASKFAVAVEKLNEKLKKDEFLGKGTVTISEFVSQSPSLCAVSDFARVHLDRRLTWGESKESAVGEIKAVLKDLGLEKDAEVKVLFYDGKCYTGETYSMEKYYRTWKMPEDHTVVQTGAKAYKKLFGKDVKFGRWVFSTNCVTICGEHKVPCIGFGPGKEEHAHAPNECVPIDDLEKCSAFYAMYAYQLAQEVAKKK